MANNSDIQFKMRIASISVLRFSQYDVGDFDVNKKDAIEFQSDFSVRILEDSKEVAIDSTIKLRIQELDKYFGELKTTMNFSIVPFKPVIEKKKDGYQLPNVLMVNLISIVTGTIRGILYEKLRGTVLQNEILPLINVRELIAPEKIK